MLFRTLNIPRNIFLTASRDHEDSAMRGSDLKRDRTGSSLSVQRLRLYASTAGGVGSIPGWRTNLPYALQCGQKRGKKKTRKEAKKMTSKH